MPANALIEFEALAAETGIVLPDLLRSLLATGKTVYGPEWVSTWREQALQGSLPFISWYDFEWIEAADARREIEEWLNPGDQAGKVFLPFAQSGAGDLYCLMPLDAHSTGVALIWHDDETSRIGYRSFDDFVAVRFLETFANLDHLADDFPEEQVIQCLRHDVSSVTEPMNEAMRHYLKSFADLPATHHEFRHGPKSRPENVLSLISQERLELERSRFPAPDTEPFTIVARWEINPPILETVTITAEPAPDWRTQALNPDQKFAAIQSYRQEFDVSLAEAKKAIDHYIVANRQD
jgi:hypothetical protein